MRRSLYLFFIILTLIFVLTICLPISFAQDYTRLNLPEGAKARLGKGSLSGNVAFSPDGSLLAVASSIGIWLYDTATYQEIQLLSSRGHGDHSYGVVFSPDGRKIASRSYHLLHFQNSML